MKDPRTAAAFGAAVALCFPVTTLGQTSATKRDAGARGASGASVVQFEESRGTAIIYLEEAGGMVSSLAAPVSAARAPAAAAARPAPAAAPARAPAPTPPVAAAQPARRAEPPAERPSIRTAAAPKP
jgi:hypothetical protein